MYCWTLARHSSAVPEAVISWTTSSGTSAIAFSICSGVAPELLAEIGAKLTWPATEAQIQEAMHLVPDEVVQLITASGTADECRAKVQEYVDAGCTCPVLYPLGDDVPAMIDAFATVSV